MGTESEQMALRHKPQMEPPSNQLIFTYDRKGRCAIGVGMGGARWAIAHPLLKVGGPAIGFGPPTFRRGPFPKVSSVFFATGLRD